jgi:hypothetical protein
LAGAEPGRQPLSWKLIVTRAVTEIWPGAKVLSLLIGGSSSTLTTTLWVMAWARWPQAQREGVLIGAGQSEQVLSQSDQPFGLLADGGDETVSHPRVFGCAVL